MGNAIKKRIPIWVSVSQRVKKQSGAGAPKAPLCKGSCHANSMTEGLLQ
jgi:hypothetical protein